MRLLITLGSCALILAIVLGASTPQDKPFVAGGSFNTKAEMEEWLKSYRIARQPIVSHTPTWFYDEASDRIMLEEDIRYEDGSAVRRVGPAKSQFMPQEAPQPFTPDPRCSPLFQSATIAFNNPRGVFTASAEVDCIRISMSTQACNPVGTEFDLWILSNGAWQLLDSHVQVSQAITCNQAVYPAAIGGTGGVLGTYKAVWSGWDYVTGALYWSIELDVIQM